MRNTIHQMLINFSSHTVPNSSRRRCSFSSCMMVNGNLSRGSLVNQLLGFMNSISNGNLQYFFAIKTSHLNLSVCCYNNGICLLNFFFGQYILRTTRTIGFCFQSNPYLCGCTLQILGSHIGVSNSCRTGSYR